MGVVAFQQNFIYKNSWWSSPLGHSFPTTDWQSAFFILFITWKGKCVCVCVCDRERERETERERNPMSFKEKINCHGKKKKSCTIKKKSVCYSRPYHLEKITTNILPNIITDLLIQTFVLVYVCMAFYYLLSMLKNKFGASFHVNIFRSSSFHRVL